jgi:hypothetical protein
MSAANRVEQGLQYYLDSLGYNIDVANDELGDAVFCGLEGVNTATMVIEVAGSAVWSTSGYYEAGNPTPLYQLFGPTNVPGDSISFTFETFDSIGFYMSPNLPGEEDIWYTESSLNSDAFDHAWVFATGVPHEFLICFEDLPSGGDEDYQDLVYRISFANDAPEITLPDDFTVVMCGPEPVCFDVTAIDPNCGADSLWLTMISGEGTFVPAAGLGQIDATHCFLPSDSGVYSFVFEAEDILGAIVVNTVEITVLTGTAPEVNINDTSVVLCEPAEICLPVEILAPNCDIGLVTSNLGDYSGSRSDFDQVAKINSLGGSMTQIGGGAPGTVLYDASDFVLPVNSQSGVSVTLPNFAFADHVVNHGSFPTGPTPANSVDLLLGPPTDLTFTTDGPGGPDGSDGDGSVSFNKRNKCELGFNQYITTCNGANVDFVVFTDTDDDSSVKFEFREDGSKHYEITIAVPGGSASSGLGGLTLDLPDGLTFNEVKIECKSDGKCDIDAVAARTAPSSTTEDVCFWADTSGVYEVIVTATAGAGDCECVDGLELIELQTQLPYAGGTVSLEVRAANKDKLDTDPYGVDVETFDGSLFTSSTYTDAVAITRIEAIGGVAYVTFEVNVDLIGLDKMNANTDYRVTLGSEEIEQRIHTSCSAPICCPSVYGDFILLNYVDNEGNECDDGSSEDCDNVGSDTAMVYVSLSSAPVVDAGADFSQFMCAFDEVCFDVAISDIDDNLITTELTSGPGTFTGSQVCFTPTLAGAYTFVLHAVDDCGLEDFDTVVVTITDNDAPIADEPSPLAVAQCLVEEICHDFTANDPNGGPLTWSHYAGVGAITPGGHFCFTPTTTGSYGVAVIVTDSCGLADTTSMTFNVVVNSAPVAFEPVPPAPRFQCAAEEICHQFSATDAEGGTLNWNLTSGVGSLTMGGLWCFTPTGSDWYAATVIVTDTCGAADTTYIAYEVTLNSAPTIVFGNDTTLMLCDPQEICLTYGVSDGDGLTGVTEVMMSGYGALDAANDQVCFTPTVDGTYEFIVSATDSCGASAVDTIVANVSFGAVAMITCPASPIEVFLCQVDEVCQALAIVPVTATVTVSHGTYAAGELCFTADTSGSYVITVIAEEACGSDTCEITFDVEIGQAAQIDCPDAVTEFICAAGEVCVPVGIFGSDVTVTVSPFGTHAAGNVCFQADTSGHYELTLIADTDCGSDTCVVVADITINTAPVAVNPSSAIDTFLCDGGPVCYPFHASDVDGPGLIWSRLDGDGTVSSDGQWCVEALSGGTWSVTAEVVDPCGAADTVVHTMNVAINSAPMVDLGADTSVFNCTTGEICLPYTIYDADDNIIVVELVSGVAYLNETTNELCFTPPVDATYRFVVRVEDECGVNHFDTIDVAVDLNQSPTVYAGDDQTIFACATSEICWPVAAGDPDGNLADVVLTGPGSYNGNLICFTPTGTYNYEFILTATDECGVAVVDTVAVYYTLNSTPVANAGADQTLFQCIPTEVCWPVSCSDVDDNLTGCALVSGSGTYDGNSICFTPDATGVYEFVLEASDACGATGYDTVAIDVTINSAPVCTVPNDTTLFQCVATEVCLPAFATDVDDNLAFCQIISGPGTLVGSDWCYTPVSDQTVTVVLHCEDDCGAICESEFTVEFDVNDAPAIAFGADTSIFQCTVEEICLPFTSNDPDDPRPRTISLVSGDGTLDLDGSQVCFTPTAAGQYTFVIRIEDECGLFDEDTIIVEVTANSVPLADAGDDQDLFLCDSVTSVCWPAGCSDVDGNLSDCLFNGPGIYDGTNICFIPIATGSYTFTLRAVDDCGLEVTDTVVIKATINSTPVVTFDDDTTLFLCQPQEVCVDYTVDDADGIGGLTESMISGYGTLDTEANNVCFTPTNDGDYTIIVGAYDSCGALGVDTIVVSVSFGVFAEIICPSADFDVFLCDADPIVQPLTVTPAGASVSTSFGTFNDGAVRFLADTAGTYTITVIADASCGSDTCEVVFNVDFNTPPVADAGADQSLFQCIATEMCWPASCSDADDNQSSCELIVSPAGATYNGSQICFTPNGTSSNLLVLRAIDACGEEHHDSVTIDVTINSAPTVVAQTDTVLFQCTPQEICLTYTTDDPDGTTGLIETMAGGYGTIDTDANTICFTPPYAGTFEFVISATDPCGVVAQDTVLATVTLGEVTNIDCPSEAIDVFLCQAEWIYQALAITPDSADISVSYGEYIDGQLQFFADTSGTYLITVIAGVQCGADTCEMTFNVEIGELALIDCPDPSSEFLCQAENICRPLGIYGAGAQVTVNPIGDYSSGNLCFFADTAGHYAIEVIATTDCGADTCLVEVDVTINSAPVMIDPDTPVDTFLCATDQICYQFAATDDDGHALTYTRLSGDGSVTSDGLWCFNSNDGGDFTVMVAVADPCTAADTASLTYHVTVNSAPVVTLGSDTTVFLCEGGDYCFNYDISDGDDNVTLEELSAGVGSIDTNADEVCFTPTGDGTYQFVVRATDACGATGVDTINVTVETGTVVTVTCPADTSLFLCEPVEVCRPVAVSLSDADVTVTPIGSYENGQVCFDADTAGHYVINVLAESACGDDNCSFAVDVTFNSSPVVIEPAPVDTFVCDPLAAVCPLEAHDADGDDMVWMKLSGDGAVSPDGIWTFDATTTGVYEMCAQVVDACGGADTICHSYTVTVNSVPTVAFARSSREFLCDSEEICFDYSVSDIDDNIILEELHYGGGYIDTLNNRICFTPDTSGYYFFDLRVHDGCGATAIDTMAVFIDINQPPTADAGADRNVFQCVPAEICWPAGCTDPDDNLTECYVVGGLATVDGDDICFTPDTAGTYTLVLRTVDDCDAFDEDTVLVTIELNSPPVCDLPGDVDFFQCQPTEVSLPIVATDPDQNFSHCELMGGPGSIVDGNWTYTPTADQTATIKVMCLDDCGAFCEDSFVVAFDLNSPPIVDIGEDQVMFLCQPTTICWPTSATDPDGNLESVELVSENGTYNQGTGEICFNVPAGERSYPFVLRAIDTCGAISYDTTLLTIEYNTAPIPGLPPDMVAYLDTPGEVCFDVNPFDPDGNLDAITVAPFGSYDAGAGAVCFEAPASGDYCLVVTALDDCQATTVDTICIQVVIDECLHVQVEKTHNSIQGKLETVRIFLNGSGKDLGAYDLLVAYDASALSVQNVFPGELITDCGWEYFTYRFGANGNCESCPNGQLRIIAIAETNNGANHPGCYLDDQIGSLADIEFLVSDDRTLECQYAPVRFMWLDCGDNAFSSKSGDTLWISRYVYDFEGRDMTDNSYGFPGLAGAPDTCLVPTEPGKPTALRCIDFTNGGVDIVCADSIDGRGDINLNEVAYEIADAVMFSNYFIFGLATFNVNVDGQIAATDVNADGITLSVADLVYLIRVVVGDVPAIPKLNPDQSNAVQLAISNDQLEIIASEFRVGAISLLIEGEAKPTLTAEASLMDMRYNFDGENTRVLIYDNGGTISLGAGPILNLNGATGILEIEVGSFDGMLLKPDLNLIPTEFTLAQNYPNPFNPSTTFEFGLPQASDWRLVVFNILGQTVQQWDGQAEAGFVTVRWDASQRASGVYFYRLEAGDFTTTKKMVLLK